MVKDICANAGIEGQKTNHSLRATGASELFHAGVPEKVIQERTGHLSLSGLHQYELTNFGQQLAISKVLSFMYQQLLPADQPAKSDNN